MPQYAVIAISHGKSEISYKLLGLHNQKLVNNAAVIQIPTYQIINDV